MRRKLKHWSLAIVAGLGHNAGVIHSAANPSQPEPAPPVHAAEAVGASNAFGIELFRQLASKGQDGNVFLSPYSVSIALAMAAEGARGETEREMSAVLHFPETNGSRPVSIVSSGYNSLAQRFAAAAGGVDSGTREQITKLRAALEEANAGTNSAQGSGDWRKAEEWRQKAESAASQLNTLLATVDRFDLRVANALWVEQSFALVPEYVRTIDKFYGTGNVTPLDFIHDGDGSRRRINTWVEDHTEKRIKDLLSAGSITPDARLIITNAVYFKGEWAMPFSEASTREEDFKLPGGAVGPARMMQDHRRGSTPYAAFNGDGSYFDTPRQVPRAEAERPKTYPEEDGFTMVELPYKGGELSMVLILPRRADGLAALEARLTSDKLASWLQHLDSRTVDTAIPRFKLEFEQELSNILRSMGMKRAFVPPGSGPYAADFGGISDSDDPARQLYIGIVKHKAWVEVTEKGTEAAAATAVAMRAAAAVRPVQLVPFYPVFRADHPFLFLIRDRQSGLILFLGRMANPPKQS